MNLDLNWSLVSTGTWGIMIRDSELLMIRLFWIHSHWHWQQPEAANPGHWTATNTGRLLLRCCQAVASWTCLKHKAREWMQIWWRFDVVYAYLMLDLCNADLWVFHADSVQGPVLCGVMAPLCSFMQIYECVYADYMQIIIVIKLLLL